MKTPRQGRKLPLWKKLVFSLVTTGLFFGLLELLLWLVGVPPLSELEDPFSGFSERISHFQEVVDGEGETVVSTAETKKNHFHNLAFFAKKAPGATRVISVGGSTTYGRPFWDRTSFSGWLREILPREDSSTAWEVLNAGGISYASYRIVSVMRELARYEPDWFVVYVGQNEFLEYQTYEDLIDLSVMQRSTALLSRTRTATVLHRIFAGDKQSEHTALPVLRAVDSVGPDAYARDDAQAHLIVSHFEDALVEMIQVAQDAGARIVFVVPTSNLADFSPFKSELAAGLSPADAADVELHLNAGRRLLREGDAGRALAVLEAASRIDDRHADVLFATARALTALGRHEDAAVLYARAKNEDIVPLRAVSSLIDAIRRIGGEDVSVVDFHAMAAARAEFGVPGDALFADHVHPRIAGNEMIAEGVARVLLGHAPSALTLEAVGRKIESAIDRPRYARELVALSRMLESLGKPRLAARRIDDALALDPGSFHANLMRGTRRLGQGRPSDALPSLERALAADPDAGGALAAYAAACAAVGRTEDARKSLAHAVALLPDDPVLRERLGALLASNGRAPEALEHFEAAVRIAPDSAKAHSNLALTYARLGRPQKAEAHYKSALELDVDFAPAHYNYAILLEDTGRPDQAARELREALRIAPDHQGARGRLDALRADN